MASDISAKILSDRIERLSARATGMANHHNEIVAKIEELKAEGQTIAGAHGELLGVIEELRELLPGESPAVEPGEAV